VERKESVTFNFGVHFYVNSSSVLRMCERFLRSSAIINVNDYDFYMWKDQWQKAWTISRVKEIRPDVKFCLKTGRSLPAVDPYDAVSCNAFL
jgi:hypothetical protein